MARAPIQSPKSRVDPRRAKNWRGLRSDCRRSWSEFTGGGKNMKHIEASIEYISRDGEIEIEDENGDLHKGLDGVKDVRDAWARGRIGIPEEGQKRKEAFNIILSMPPGTDRESVKDSGRAFAAAQFQNHQYVFASHEDERHPHVHLIVKAVAHDGIRLNPRKADLQLWRVRSSPNSYGREG